jgi:hypothetical protein
MCGFDLILRYPDFRMFKEDPQKSDQARDEVDDEDEDEDERDLDSRPHLDGYV